MELKYLFTVLYKDGTSYVQNAQDIPEGGEGSCFTDVLKSGKDIHVFELSNKETGAFFSVNLITGQFCMNHMYFEIEGKKQLPISNPKRELIFFRQHQHDVIQGTKEETAHRVTYCIGWKTKIGGKVYQEIIKVT